MNKKAGAGIIVIIILAILVVGGGGYYYYSTSSNPKIISETSETVLSCTDSDGNDIFVKGYTSYEKHDPVDDEVSLSSLEDICDYYHAKTDSRVGLVRESFCEENTLKTILSTCGRGYVCRQGRCAVGGEDIPVCHDTDDGKNVNERGEIYGYGGSGRDECYNYALEGSEKGEGGYISECEGDNCYVWEYYCEGDLKASEIIPCDNGCENGACL